MTSPITSLNAEEPNVAWFEVQLCTAILLFFFERANQCVMISSNYFVVLSMPLQCETQ